MKKEEKALKVNETEKEKKNQGGKKKKSKERKEKKRTKLSRLPFFFSSQWMCLISITTAGFVGNELMCDNQAKNLHSYVYPRPDPELYVWNDSAREKNETERK